jgi:8-oxo-dGTP diphosphatase
MGILSEIEMSYTSNHIRVSCAIIERDGLVLAAQRSGSMSFPLKWEFPGGKIKEGESPEDCLSRELIEEMDIYPAVGRPLPPSTHHYDEFTVTLFPFVCSIRSGTITLHEHAAVTWLPPLDLASLDWAEADRPVLESYQEYLSASRKIQ